MWFFLLPFLLFPDAFADIPPITVLARPQVVAAAPIEYLRIEVWIKQDARNRQWCVSVDGPNFYSESCDDMEGKNAPILYNTFALHLRDDGVYEVKASTYDVDGKVLASDEQDVLVGGKI